MERTARIHTGVGWYQGIRPSGLPGGVPEPGHGGPPVLLPFQTQSLCTVLLVSEPFHQACTASRIETPLMRIWFHHMVVLLPVPPSDTGSAASTGFLHNNHHRAEKLSKIMIVGKVQICSLSSSVPYSDHAKSKWLLVLCSM